jgi:demethylmenaquinone methyltransferase/2-methoxy-6-polyprenyl-1,4-benzoquinol methylase
MSQPETLPIRVGNADGSGIMFDRIAKRYDLLNRLISFGLDHRWRQKLLRNLGPIGSGDSVLDVATGTGDVAIAIAKAFEGARVTGLDPSIGMLNIGREKIAARNLEPRVELIAGDAQEMPFQNDTFAAACISFGIRNVPDRVKGLKEMARVTKPGGKVVVLELSEPRGGLLTPFAKLHIHWVIPILGTLLSSSKEYWYLQKSIAAFPPAKEFAGVMESAGLENVELHQLTLGTAHLYVGTVS